MIITTAEDSESDINIMSNNKNRRRTNRARKKKALLKSSPNHVITRMYVANVVKSTSDTGVFRSYNLATFPTSDIISLYQDYKIKSVKLDYLLVNAPNNNADFPTLYIAPSHYNLGGVTPANRDEVLQYKGVKCFQFGPSRLQYTQTFKPYIQMNTTGSGLVSSSSQWLTTQSSLVPHLVCVEWIDRYNSTSSPTHTLQLNVTITVECRMTR